MRQDTESLARTRTGEPRGYIDPGALRELWFHTGTACNLSCSFCLEGSKPGDTRLEQVRMADVQPLIEEALGFGVEQFSFTGGEPFVNKDFVRILDFALDHRPCLVLTNGTKPLRKRFSELLPLASKPHPLRFRISLDYPDPARHDLERGAGNFREAVRSVRDLTGAGFAVSIARLGAPGEDAAAVNAAYRPFLWESGAPEDVSFVIFPDFHGPGAEPSGVPEITENCMNQYHSSESRESFMCHYSKMAVKIGGKMRIYACTLVDDDPSYDLGGTLAEAMSKRVMLRHHRCYACFAYGASCSDPARA